MATSAQFPSSIKSFTEVVDNVNVVQASDVNPIYAEVTAVENTLGTNPATSPSWSSSFTSLASGQAWSTVSARLANIESGLKLTVPLVNSSGYIVRISGGTA